MDIYNKKSRIPDRLTIQMFADIDVIFGETKCSEKFFNLLSIRCTNKFYACLNISVAKIFFLHSSMFSYLIFFILLRFFSHLGFVSLKHKKKHINKFKFSKEVKNIVMIGEFVSYAAKNIYSTEQALFKTNKQNLRVDYPI